MFYNNISIRPWAKLPATIMNKSLFCEHLLNTVSVFSVTGSRNAGAAGIDRMNFWLLSPKGRFLLN